VRANVREQRRARALGELEHRFEAVGAAEVGIGHFAKSEFGDEIEQQPEAARVIRRLQCAQIAQIAQIHRQDVVEPREVVDDDLPGA
jgi:hypothetical protein